MSFSETRATIRPRHQVTRSRFAVSRWLNRPISQTISRILLAMPGVRPIHATFGTGLIALLMFAAMKSAAGQRVLS